MGLPFSAKEDPLKRDRKGRKTSDPKNSSLPNWAGTNVSSGNRLITTAEHKPYIFGSKARASTPVIGDGTNVPKSQHKGFARRETLVKIVEICTSLGANLLQLLLLVAVAVAVVAVVAVAAGAAVAAAAAAAAAEIAAMK